MRRQHKLQQRRAAGTGNDQRGYMLITLMLIVALAAMAMLAVLPDISQQIKRDREEEMIHRGTQYMRAIQHYYKRMGRYPTRIEDLQNTNNMRFIRKAYTDPVNRDPQTGKEREFKLLHLQDVNIGSGPMLSGAAGQGGLPGQAGMPGQSGMLGALMAGGMMGQGGMQGGFGPGSFGQSGPFGGMQQSGSSTGTQNNSGDDSGTGNSSSGQGSSGSGGNSSPGSATGASGSGQSAGLTGQVFGGGPIIGVASTNKKDTTVREFNKKNHYNDWLFIYDPTSDRGGLVVGPWQIPPTTTIPGVTPAGQLTQGTQQPQGFGSGITQGFGSGSGFGGGQSQNPGGQTPQNPQPPQNAPPQ